MMMFMETSEKISEEQGEKSNILKDNKVRSSSKIVLQLA